MDKKKIVYFIIAVITGITIGKYVYDSYNKTETKDVFKYKNENVYMLQYGVYSSEENMINSRLNEIINTYHKIGFGSLNLKIELLDGGNELKEEIKKELKIMCVLFTEDVGGILRLEFDQEGSLNLVTEAFDEDLLYDEIGCELKIKQLQKDKQQLFSSLELFYKVFYLEDY